MRRRLQPSESPHTFALLGAGETLLRGLRLAVRARRSIELLERVRDRVRDRDLLSGV